MVINIESLKQEITYKTSRSGGAGGQHVNKVSSKVELIFDVQNSSSLTPEQKELVFKKIPGRVDNNGVLHLFCDETRSQYKNKNIVFERLIELLTKALKPTKKRKQTKPSKKDIQNRLDNKKKLSDKKSDRRFKLD